MKEWDIIDKIVELDRCEQCEATKNDLCIQKGYSRRGVDYRIQCINCGATIDWCTTLDEAIRVWNWKE